MCDRTARAAYFFISPTYAYLCLFTDPPFSTVYVTKSIVLRHTLFMWPNTPLYVTLWPEMPFYITKNRCQTDYLWRIRSQNREIVLIMYIMYSWPLPHVVVVLPSYTSGYAIGTHRCRVCIQRVPRQLRRQYHATILDSIRFIMRSAPATRHQRNASYYCVTIVTISIDVIRWRTIPCVMTCRFDVLHLCLPMLTYPSCIIALGMS
jgi:hypothetical protein